MRLTREILASSAATLLLLAASAPEALAREKSVELRLQALESRLPDADRMAALEKKVDASTSPTLARDLQELQAEVREIHGEIEQLTHDSQAQAQRQRQLYQDLD